MTTSADMSDTEFCEILERNGYPSAAERIWMGEDRASATAYILEDVDRYDDGESRWLRDHIRALQASDSADGGLPDKEQR
jgi:hypothetical protein